MFWAIIVLPRPWGATRTTLRAAARKSRWSAASTAARSSLVGQAQSKSAIGLKRPRRARASRRSRPRRARSSSSCWTTCSRSCVGLQRCWVARAMRSLSWAAVARRPRVASWSASGIVVVIGDLRGGRGEAIVGGERVRRDVEVADARVVGEYDRERRGRAAGAGLLVEDMGDGGGADGAPGERLGERGVHGR